MSGFKFSAASRAQLSTCDVRLQRVAEEALATSEIDFGIACGHRGQAEQEECCAKGLSKTPWPTSKHNASPSKAFDFYPVFNNVAQWKDHQAFKDVAHHLLTTADRLGIRLRWGGDWNCNGIADEKFVDMPHIELKD